MGGVEGTLPRSILLCNRFNSCKVMIKMLNRKQIKKRLCYNYRAFGFPLLPELLVTICRLTGFFLNYAQSLEASRKDRFLEVERLYGQIFEPPEEEEEEEEDVGFAMNPEAVAHRSLRALNCFPLPMCFFLATEMDLFSFLNKKKKNVTFSNTFLDEFRKRTRSLLKKSGPASSLGNSCTPTSLYMITWMRLTNSGGTTGRLFFDSFPDCLKK